MIIVAAFIAGAIFIPMLTCYIHYLSKKKKY